MAPAEADLRSGSSREGYPWYWVMAVGGLAHSAVSLYRRAEQALHLCIKALGFVLLLGEQSLSQKSAGSA
jgi:hypothetical protein